MALCAMGLIHAQISELEKAESYIQQVKIMHVHSRMYAGQVSLLLVKYYVQCG